MTKEGLTQTLKSLARSFPKGGWITANGEFIANTRTNAYFNLLNCDTTIDVYCKVLEWLSRDCFKTQPYSTDGKNAKYHQEMLASVNDFLCTQFTEDDMEIIYHKLGNAVNHKLTLRFVLSDYDMSVLDEEGNR